MAVWDNPDVGLLYGINGLAASAPTWVDHATEYIGEYGIVIALLLLAGWAWWHAARRRETREDAVTAVAGLVWAPLAAAVALLVNIPIRAFVARPRPFVEHKGLDVLVRGKHDFSFVSDHATMTMALGVGIFMVNRRYGLISIALAVAEGFCRVYMGVHYPTDVIGGLALGTAVVLLLAPPAGWLLTPVIHAGATSGRVGALVWAGPRVAAEGRTAAQVPDGAGSRKGGDRDLAA